MKEFIVGSKRLLQVFLPEVKDSYEISEVYLNEKDKISCSCSTYLKRNSCKHSRLIQARVDANNGRYIPEILRSATPEETELAKTSDEAYNHFLRKYGKIEVY
jgi:hypothetical protein